jgi:hypothetical protein
VEIFLEENVKNVSAVLHLCLVWSVLIFRNIIFLRKLKGIGSILFLKNGLTNFQKSYKSHLRGNNYEVCRAVAHCLPNILDVMVLETIKTSLKIRQPL